MVLLLVFLGVLAVFMFGAGFMATSLPRRGAYVLVAGAAYLGAFALGVRYAVSLQRRGARRTAGADPRSSRIATLAYPVAAILGIVVTKRFAHESGYVVFLGCIWMFGLGLIGWLVRSASGTSRAVASGHLNDGGREG